MPRRSFVHLRGTLGNTAEERAVLQVAKGFEDLFNPLIGGQDVHFAIGINVEEHDCLARMRGRLERLSDNDRVARDSIVHDEPNQIATQALRKHLRYHERGREEVSQILGRANCKRLMYRTAKRTTLVSDSAAYCFTNGGARPNTAPHSGKGAAGLTLNPP